ncbi:aldehyde dehydrogenase family protein [Roseimaritima ulvae]|uniref:Aldehyde dehydrogenase family protein n=1 Tax=Roseimaritima ulvae TaxID=980254 RepID=A0A5B9QTE2_9BACT|nr:aldehyde dehydrogenase [Roseimaritima ulvae]QEG42327.1 Aldehyde dehydrogenase family protein [Roseimaritima ulvae]
MMIAPQPSSSTDIDHALDRLAAGAGTLQRMSLPQRLSLLERCIEAVADVAVDWVEAACEAQRIDERSPARTEEVTTGPLATMRFLRLAAQTYRDIERQGAPRLPGTVTRVAGQCRIAVFPTPLMYDSLLFRPMTAETWLHPEVPLVAPSAASTARLVDTQRQSDVVVVLGAGNVSSIPVTDALTKIFLEGSVVALKMNPVNDYLGPIFQRGLAPLIDSGLLQLVYGGVPEGKALIASEQTAGVHITGSIESHDNIVWGTDADREQRRAENRPRLNKTITSELGNVTPWAILPGRYSDAELRAQVQAIASSIVNNVSFNCIATKVLITCRDWPQREQFHQLLREVLDSTPLRHAYYPGAGDRFARFSGRPAEDPQRLPWTLLPDVDPRTAPHLLQEESFTPVCAELVLDAESELDFLQQSVEVMNDQIWGTLAASLTVPDAFQRSHADALDAALQKLRYGTIGINQWSALSFALMSPPWGGHPGASLQDAQSGIDFVHNTYLLDRPEKTVLRAPLRVKPKPIWDSTHRHPERVTWDLLDLYRSESMWKLLKLAIGSFTG